MFQNNAKITYWIKGIVSDSNNIFLWYELKDINKKKMISKISVDSNFTFTSYTGLCAMALLYRLQGLINSGRWESMWKLLLFHTEWFLLNSFGEMCFLEESYK